jgi:hypothetical protein
MMKYLCLIYSDETQWPKLPKEETDKMLAEYGAFGESIKQGGQFIAGHRLHPTNTATTVRIRDGKMSTTDGPFAETKEHLGGFVLIEAADMAEARRIAAGIPMAKVGSIEIRPIYDIPTWE